MSDGKLIFETLLDESGVIKGLNDIEANAGQKLSVIGSAFEKTGGVMIKAFTAPIIGAATAFMGTAEATRDYRMEMGKLETAFTTSGFSAEAAKNTYSNLFAVLGEEDQSVETANHLSKLCDTEKELNTWTDICTGVFATFGDSLPIEGLTEAANETAKVGQVTGPLADALNWAGVSEDEFNQKLAACSTEQERQALITDTLNGLYGEASEKYKTLNGDVMEAHKAQEKMTDAMARIGEIAEPIMTMLKDKAADLLNALAGLLELFASAPAWVQGLVLGFTGVLAAAGPFLVILGKVTTGLGNIIDFSTRVKTSLLKKAVATATDTVSTTANTVATTANTAATNLAVKAKSALNKVLTLGKWALLGGAIIGASALLIMFAKDSDGATQMVQNFADKAVEMAGKLASMVPQIVQALAAMLPSIINAGVDILMALIQGIVQAIPQITAAIPQILNTILLALTANLSLILNGGVQIMIGLINGIVQAIPQLVAMLPQVIMAIVNAITMNLHLIIQAAIQIVLALIQGLIQALPRLVSYLPQIINAIVTGITQNLPMIINGAVQIILALIQGLIKAIPQLVASLPKIISAIVRGLLSMLGQIFSVGVQILKKLWSGISSWVGSLGSKVTSFAKSLPGKIKSGIGSLVSVGADWVRGLWNGIGSVKDWIIGKIKGFGSSCLNAIKDFFGISSPSKVMDREVGRMLPAGLARGILAKTKIITAAVKKQMAAVKEAYTLEDINFDLDPNPPVVQAYKARFANDRARISAISAMSMNDEPKVEQTINFYSEQKSPVEIGRMLKKQAMFGLAGV